MVAGCPLDMGEATISAQGCAHDHRLPHLQRRWGTRPSLGPCQTACQACRYPPGYPSPPHARRIPHSALTRGQAGPDTSVQRSRLVLSCGWLGRTPGRDERRVPGVDLCSGYPEPDRVVAEGENRVHLCPVSTPGLSRPAPGADEDLGLERNAGGHAPIPAGVGHTVTLGYAYRGHRVCLERVPFPNGQEHDA